MKAQVFLALPGGVESASRQYRYSVALCGLRERRPIAMREAHPQGLAALHARHVPGGQAAGELGAEVVMAGLPDRGLALAQLLKAWQQFGGGELCRDVHAEAVHGEQPRRPMRGSGARTQPMRRPPQTLLLSEPIVITSSA